MIQEGKCPGQGKPGEHVPLTPLTIFPELPFFHAGLGCLHSHKTQILKSQLPLGFFPTPSLSILSSTLREAHNWKVSWLKLYQITAHLVKNTSWYGLLEDNLAISIKFLMCLPSDPAIPLGIYPVSVPCTAVFPVPRALEWTVPGREWVLNKNVLNDEMNEYAIWKDKLTSRPTHKLSHDPGL